MRSSKPSICYTERESEMINSIGAGVPERGNNCVIHTSRAIKRQHATPKRDQVRINDAERVSVCAEWVEAVCRSGRRDEYRRKRSHGTDGLGGGWSRRELKQTKSDTSRWMAQDEHRVNKSTKINIILIIILIIVVSSE